MKNEEGRMKNFQRAIRRFCFFILHS